MGKRCKKEGGVAQIGEAKEQGTAEREREKCKESGQKKCWLVRVKGGVDGLFMSVVLPGEDFPPVYHGVRCRIEMAVCMYCEQLRDLKGHRLMSSL